MTRGTVQENAQEHLDQNDPNQRGLLDTTPVSVMAGECPIATGRYGGRDRMPVTVLSFPIHLGWRGTPRMNQTEGVWEPGILG